MTAGSPTPDDILYRVGIHVADTDAQALRRSARRAGAGDRRGGYATSNTASTTPWRDAGYYGRDAENQRGRVQHARPVCRSASSSGSCWPAARNGPASRSRRIHDEIGAGILDLVFIRAAATRCCTTSSCSARRCCRA